MNIKGAELAEHIHYDNMVTRFFSLGEGAFSPMFVDINHHLLHLNETQMFLMFSSKHVCCLLGRSSRVRR